ncbi:ROK family protein [Kribbella sp. NPDC056861]|uniref:ROK family protein n=1 Tax=Kribbella sp. NPDC056861 TaxID=3154857 RepID=UPI00343D2A80
MNSGIPVLEIGGSHVTAAMVTPSTGQVEGVYRAGLDSKASADSIVGELCAAAKKLPLAKGLAVALPGPFDFEAGVAWYKLDKFASLYGQDLGQRLRDELGLDQVVFMNDAEAFTVGEWSAGELRGLDRCVGITIGTGIGSAFLADGRVVRTGDSVPPGGELYQTTFDGKPIEEWISARAILRRYDKALAAAPAGDAGDALGSPPARDTDDALGTPPARDTDDALGTPPARDTDDALGTPPARDTGEVLGTPSARDSGATEDALGTPQAHDTGATKDALGTPQAHDTGATKHVLGTPQAHDTGATENALGAPTAHSTGSSAGALGAPLARSAGSTEHALGAPPTRSTGSTAGALDAPLARSAGSTEHALSAPPARSTGVKEIAEAARAGDAAAKSALVGAFQVLSDALVPWLERFGATRVVLGGSISGAFDVVAEVFPFPVSATADTEHSALIGAAEHYLRSTATEN